MKKKRMATAALAALMALTAVGGMTVYGASDTKTATLNNAKVRFNDGAVQTIQCYNIEGFNFVRARDIPNNLDMAVSAIQNGDTGIMVHPYLKPTSTATPEKLTQKTAKVKVVEGNLIYDGWVSKAECFLLNGRYYFKLADFANASDNNLDVAIETVEFEAKGEYAKAPYMDEHYGITVTWNNDTKVIDVDRVETDLVQYFNDIRGGKPPVAKPDKEEVVDKEEEKEPVVEKEDKFEATGILTSAPKEGKILANILKDEDEGAYLDNGKVNMDNLTKPYTYTSEKNVGQCTWYAKGRFIETHGIDINKNPFTGTNTCDEWVESAKSAKYPDVDGTTDKNAIEAGCIVVWKGHVGFVEWVDFDENGEPVKVYFTEANSGHVTTDGKSIDGMKKGIYYPDYDGKVKVFDFDDFINRDPFVGYVVAK